MWKEIFKQYVFRTKLDASGTIIYATSLEYFLSILKMYPNMLSDKRREIYNEIEDNLGKNEEIARQKFLEFMRTLVDQALEEKSFSSIFPTIEELNLLKGEEEGIIEEKIWKHLFLTYSSVKVGNYLVNIDNLASFIVHYQKIDLPLQGVEWLWQTLINRELITKEGNVKLTSLGRKLGINLSSNSEPFFNIFALLDFWVKKWIGYIKEYEDIYHPILDFAENTSLIIQGWNDKKQWEYYQFAIYPLITRWLDPSVKLIEIMNSYGDGAPEDIKDTISKKREQLLFYLLKHNKINGELLSQLTTMKCTYELKKDKINGIPITQRFLSNLF